MKAQLRFEKAQRDAATKFRSKFHAQTDFTRDAVYKRENRDALSSNANPNAAIVNTISRRLMELRQESFQRVGGAASASHTAVVAQLFDSVPTYRIDDDPSFASSARLLRAAVHFRVDPAQRAVQHALSIFVDHTFLWDAATAASFVSLLGMLHLPSPGSNGGAALPPTLDGAAMFRRVAPRLLDHADDYLVHECAAIAATMHKLRAAPAATPSGEGGAGEALVAALVGSVSRHHAGAKLADVSRSVVAVSRVSSPFAARLLTAVGPRLQQQAAELPPREAADVARACSRVDAPPRRLMNALADSTLVKLADTTPMDLADMLHAFRMANLRHEPFFRRSSMRQLRLLDAQTPLSISLTLSALAHFHVREPEVFSILGDRLAADDVIGSVSPFHCATTLHAFAKAKEPHPRACGALLDKFSASVSASSGAVGDAVGMAGSRGSGKRPAVSPVSLCQVIWAASVLRLFSAPGYVTKLRPLLAEASRPEVGEAVAADHSLSEMLAEAVRRVAADPLANAPTKEMFQRVAVAGR